MSLLKHTEIIECLTGGPTTVARNVEAAVIKKLAAGVDVEPVLWATERCGQKVFTLDQIKPAIAAARVKAIEEAAKVAARMFIRDAENYPAVIDEAIRNLIGANK